MQTKERKYTKETIPSSFNTFVVPFHGIHARVFVKFRVSNFQGRAGLYLTGRPVPVGIQQYWVE